MDTTELKKLAEAATPGPWIAGDDEDSDYFLVGPHDGDGLVSHPVVTLHSESNADYIAAANPAAILELLAINAELVEMVKDAAVLADFAKCWITDPAIEGMSRLKGGGDKFRAALAKAEGGGL
jgi:hypothetical protein